ncbi:MAG: tetratricopeptide repeat protein [Alphaproteobacteria bacterium]|nr:tetratricopeptide repeat protein [Alphaproteobacteria bacterium]
MNFAGFKSLLLCTVAVSMISGCAILDKKDTGKESNWFIRQFEKDGNAEAAEATVAYSQGDFHAAQEFSLEAIKANPRNQQALLVGALTAEKLGRENRARQYYEDLIVIDGVETSILGANSTVPEKITQIAKRRLRNITLKQSKLVIENRNFNISEDAAKDQNKKNISRALNKKSPNKSTNTSASSLFTASEQNAISRFLVLKEMAENDYISKEEFITRRNANIGALLPLTKKAPGVGIDQPVPAPELIVDRISILKQGVEDRAITPREFSAERDIIIEALMQPNPRARLKPKAPSKDILGAAKDLRKLEVLYDMNLITSAEKAAEKKQIEKYLGINKDPKPVVLTPNQPVSQPVATTTSQEQTAPMSAAVVEVKTTVEEHPIPIKKEIDTITKGNESVAVVSKTETVTPVVSSPF